MPVVDSVVRVKRWMWVTVAAVLLTASGDSGGESSGEAEGPVMDSFSFRLTTTSEQGEGTAVDDTVGEFDPDSGNGSAVTTSPEGTTSVRLVGGTLYVSTPVQPSADSELGELLEGSCFDRTWQSMDADDVRSGALIDINHPTGLDIEWLQTMVDTGAPELQALPSEGEGGEPASYSVTLADEDQDEHRRLLEMVVRVDDEERVVSVDWTVSVDRGSETTAADIPGDTSTERGSLTLTGFGNEVEVEAPAPEDTCNLEQQELEWRCGFAATEMNRDAMSEIYDEDREALCEIVDSFRDATGDACPEALNVPALVTSASCQPDMVRFLFEELDLDPNQQGSNGDGFTALFVLTYFDAEDSEFSEVCTPEQDLETIRVLLEAGADPCIGPDGEHEYDPSSNAPEWEPPATGISEWGEAPEVVALVEGAAVNCTP